MSRTERLAKALGASIGSFVAHFVIGAGFMSGVAFVLWLGGFLIGVGK